MTEARLGISYGTATVAAVLAWPDGRHTPLHFDGAILLPSGVWRDPHTGQLLVGAAAAQQARTRPQEWRPHPKRHLTSATITIGGQPVEAAEVIAAPLRRVAAAAEAAAGGQAHDVVLAVPAGWGPRRRTILRDAAHRAGLAEPTLVDEAIALAHHMHTFGGPPAEGAYLLVCDAGAGTFDATVLRRTGTSYTVESTKSTPDAGGLAIDTAVANHIAARNALTITGSDQAVLLHHARTAKHALSRLTTTQVPVPAGAATLTRAQLTTITRPIARKAATAAAETVAAADITTEELTGVWCAGGTARMPHLQQELANQLAITPTVADQPELAAADGALRATPPKPPPTPDRQRHWIRPAIAATVCLLSSLTLLLHVIATADDYGLYGPGSGWLINTGGYALAALFALLATTLAALATLSLTQPHQRGPQTGLAIATSAGIGMAFAIAYAFITTAQLHNPYDLGPRVSVNDYLHLSILAPLTAAITIAIIGAITAANRHPAAWLANKLRFPTTSAALAATGTLLIAYTYWSPTNHEQLMTLAPYTGGALTGAAIATAITTRPLHRTLAIPPCALIAALVTTNATYTALTTAYIITITAWWLIRATTITLAALPRHRTTTPQPATTITTATPPHTPQRT